MADEKILPLHSPSTTEKVGERSVLVQEMTWAKALAFFQLISDAVAELVQNKSDGGVSVDFDKHKIVRLVSTSERAVEHLLSASTDLTIDEISALKTSECLQLLTRCIEVNMNEEVFAQGKRLAQAFSERLGKTN